ncbi:tubulin monoglutamylase TTLL4-like isoform X2 [Daktulosphaira vitifoliae]|uniref:tubulin monoglutamylase TTLL4-like isoform X2 n=1 Tax=Daktulosphaira vitifoliae TaxID=58002 RepID=UPI0021AA8F86|nr:tubulin monoglutamylase TTLL4-like isoform X2 [Daktulosphaira vitifoliae]
MNNRSYSVLTKELNSNHLHHTMDHNSERLLKKLNPYPVLDTDPTLENVNYTISSTKPSNHLDSDIHKEHYQYHSEMQKWEVNENGVTQGEFINNDQYYMPSNKVNLHVRQPPVHRHRKVLPTVPPKSLVSINTNQKNSSHSSTNSTHQKVQIAKDNLTNQNSKITISDFRESSLEINDTLRQLKNVSKNVYDNPNHLQESVITTNDNIKMSNRYVISNHLSSSTFENNEINNISIKKELLKPLDNVTFNSPYKAGKDISSVNGTHSVCNLVHDFYEPSLELKPHNTKLKVTQSLNSEINVTKEDMPKLDFDHLFSDVQNNRLKENVQLHSALRLSLFSNIPPYIKFSSHDVKGESFPLPLQKILKWKLSSITPIVVRRTVQNSGFKLVKKSNDWVGTWGKHMKSLCFKTLRDQQKLNHFPGTFQIGRKDKLWKNLQRLMLQFSKDEFNFIPTSYILPQETKLLRQVWEKNDEDKWIVKPPASARGTGIRVISKWNQIPKKIPLVVQKYIDNPYLINDTKFDLRLYILITSINPLRIYLYDNGLVRFASVKYSSDLNTISDRYMHLTNYSINRLSSQYTQNEDANACQGHKWTLRSLWTYLEKERKIDIQNLWESLADLVVKTVISGESPMSQMCRSNLSNRYNSYELFGIDVLFDEFLKPWILEVNISPSLHTSSPLDLAVKGPLVKDLMNMVGYHIPNKMSPTTHNALLKMLGIKSPLCYDKRLYTFNLSDNEKKKQEYYSNIKSRENYIDSILNDLLPDDIRHLIEYEDELTQIGSFQKVFPTTTSYKYHQYFDSARYYNMLFDAWENKYYNNRKEGVALLEKFCQKKVHLEVPDKEEKQFKTYETHQNIKMEVEKCVDYGDDVSDQHQAIIRRSYG